MSTVGRMESFCLLSNTTIGKGACMGNEGYWYKDTMQLEKKHPPLKGHALTIGGDFNSYKNCAVG